MEWKTRLKYGSYAFLTTIVMITIVFVINLIASKSDWTIDFTKDRLYSLSIISKNVISNIDKDVKINLAYDSSFNDSIKQLDPYAKDKVGIEKLLKKYQKINSKIIIDSFDISKNPELAQKYGVDSNNSYMAVIVESGGRTKVLQYSDIYTLDNVTYETKFVGEQKITSVIKNITSDKKANLYYLTGHNSYTDITQISTLMTELNDTNYNVKALDLSTGVLPVDMDILLILALENDLSQNEVRKIDEYMATGGNLCITLVPNESSLYPNLTGLLNKYGMTTSYDAVIESDESKIYYTNTIFYADVIENPITQGIKGSGYNVIMPITTNIGILENTNGYTLKPLLKSSQTSYSKNVSNAMDSGSLAKESTDSVGPFNLAISGSKVISEGVEAKIVVLGSTYLLQPEYSVDSSNVIVTKSANTDIVLNSFAWLKGATDEISIRPKETLNSSLLMTQGDVSTLVWFVVFVLPSVILLTGFIVWYRRRRSV